MESDGEQPSAGVAVAKLSTSRRLARDVALRALYANEIGGGTIQECIEAVRAQLAQGLAPETLKFARDLAIGVLANKQRLGEIIRAHLAAGWPIERLAVLDRLAIALAAFEIYDMALMPPKVSISEAVALAKKYGDAESGRFVNGVLAGILADSPKARWSPPQQPEPEEPPAEEEPEPEVEMVEEGSPEHEELRRAGGWRLQAKQDDL